MRITCRECAADFVLPEDQIVSAGMKSSCPFCHAAFELLPVGESGPQAIEFSGEKILLRTCINCNKTFESSVEEVIPVCPKCKQVKKIKVAQEKEPKRTWKVFRGGREFEHDSEGAIREWIRQGLLDVNDLVILPEGKKLRAGQITQFTS